MSFTGKCCLVTGGTKGIGKAIVEFFAAEKARVFTCARTRRDVDSSLSEWRKKGYDVQGEVCDVSQRADLEQLTRKVSSSFDGQLHALVCNAGINRPKKALDFLDHDYDEIMDTNLRSVFHLCRMCYPLLKEGAPSSVTFIGSVASAKASAAGCIYAMSKASLKQLSMNLACEWAPDQIRVNCIAPGVTDTPMMEAAKQREEFVSRLMSETPLKRMGQPEDIARVVLFFSSSGASFVTGQTLYVDGGYSIRGLGL